MRDLDEWGRLLDWSRAVADLALPDSAVGQLKRYVETLLTWNRKVALVAQRELSSILDKHVADSLFVAAHCRGAQRVADLGSGAGFPGLVIGIVCPDLSVTLIEARGKKVSFMEEACRAAGIRNATPLHGRIEAIGADPDHRSRYDRITSRALADLDVLGGLARPFAAPGGRLLAMRSSGSPVPDGAECASYVLPDGTPRSLVTIALGN